MGNEIATNIYDPLTSKRESELRQRFLEVQRQRPKTIDPAPRPKQSKKEIDQINKDFEKIRKSLNSTNCFRFSDNLPAKKHKQN